MSTVLESSSVERSKGNASVAGRLVGPGLAMAFALAVVVLLHHDGVQYAYIGRYALYVAWGLALPGFVVQRALVGPMRTWFSELIVALTVGLVLELVAWAAFVGFDAGSVLWVWPVLTLPLLALKRVRARVLTAPRDRLSLKVMAIIGGGLASLLWMCHRQALSANPLPGGGGSIYQDLLWHMGLVHEARRSFPLGTPQVVDAGTLHYHWFSDAHMAAATLIAHVPVPVEEMRFFPVLFFVLGFAMTVVVVGEVVRRSAAMGVAALMAAATTTFTPFPRMYVSFGSYTALSPSQLFAVPLTLAFLLAVYWFIQSAREQGLRAPQTVTCGLMVILLLVGLSGAKASAPPSILGGVGLLWLWSLITRQVRAAASALLGLCVIGTAVALTVVVGGDAGSGKQLFAPLGASHIYRVLLHPRGGTGWALPGAILPGFGSHLVLSLGLLGFSVLAAIALWLSLGMGMTRRARQEPFTWLISGTLTAAMLAFYVINHPGLSEFYFMSGVLSVGIVGVVYQGSLWWEQASQRSRKIATIVSGVGFIAAFADLLAGYPKPPEKSDALFQLRLSVVILAVVVLGILFVARRSRVSVMAFTAALAVGAATAETVYQPLFVQKTKIRKSQEILLTQAAGLWIEKHVPENALMATNKHCGKQETLTCYSAQWTLSGIGGRRFLIEGWSYTPKSANRQPFFEPALLATNQKAFATADPKALQTLKKRGVQYLVAVKGATKIAPALSTVGTVVYANAQVKIFKMK